MSQTKPIEISKQEVVEAYRRIKANKGSAGIDHQSQQDFDADKTEVGVSAQIFEEYFT